MDILLVSNSSPEAQRTDQPQELLEQRPNSIQIIHRVLNVCNLVSRSSSKLQFFHQSHRYVVLSDGRLFILLVRQKYAR